MATSGFFFGGRTIKRPGAYGIGDASGLVEIAVGALNIVMLIGSALGGEPGVPMLFNLAGETQALKVLRGGPLHQAIQSAWHPSPTEGQLGADVVIALRVDPATQSNHIFQDSQTPTPADAIEAVSADWGDHTKNTQVGFLAGSTDATLRRAVIRKFDDNVNVTSPDLGLAIGIAYTGDGAATAQVHTVNGSPTLDVVVTGATDNTAGFQVPLDSPLVPTIQDLAAVIQAHDGFNVKVLGAGSIPSVQLDPMAATVNLGATVTALTAVNGALVDWVNRTVAAVVFNFKGNAAPVAVVAPTYLTGGSNGVPQPSDWINGLHQLETEPGYFLVPCTTDPAIHAECLDHVQRMSDITVKKRRVLYLGHGIGDVVFSPDGSSNITALADRIFNLNSGRVQFATPGTYEFTNNVKTLWPSYIMAAKYAGMKAGAKPQMSLTFRYVSCQGLEGNYDSVAIDQLEDAAASYVLNIPNKGYRIEHSQSAQVRTTNVLESEPSVLHVSDTLLTNLEGLLEDKYVGVPPGADLAVTLNTLKKDVSTLLEDAKAQGMIVDGQDADGKFQPAYIIDSVSFKNRRYSVKLRAAISEPGNYATIEAEYMPLSGAA